MKQTLFFHIDRYVYVLLILLFRAKYCIINACVLGMKQTDDGVNKSITQPLHGHLAQTADKK